MTKRTVKKKVKTLRNQLNNLYSPALTNGEHSIKLHWNKDCRAFDVMIIGNGRYANCTHSIEFQVGLMEKPKTLGQLFYGSRWV